MTSGDDIPSVNDSILTGNTAGEEGDGVYSWGATLSVADTTISGNSAAQDTGLAALLQGFLAARSTPRAKVFGYAGTPRGTVDDIEWTVTPEPSIDGSG